MLATDDTIVAIATPPGHGGLGVIRLSGPRAVPIARGLLHGAPELQPRQATYARVVGELGGHDAARENSGRWAGPVDEVIATSFPRPTSYTGEDVVEIAAHGSPVVLEAIVRRAVAAGARHAERGEFTLRAFLSGRIDLVQAEAVADLIEAVTPLQARAAFDQLRGTLTEAIGAIDQDLFDLAARLEASIDFPDAGYHFVDVAACASEIEAIASRVQALLVDAQRGRIIREGRQAALVGRTNTGKSSIFNKLAGSDRAIVTATAGTTRDLITESIEMEGIPVDLVDTAGVRASGDAVEREGVRRARRAAEVTDLVLLVLDASRPLNAEDRQLLERTGGRARVVVMNKMDCALAWDEGALELHEESAVRVSARTGEGLGALRQAIAERLTGSHPTTEPPALTNARHISLLEGAAQALARAAGVARSMGESGSEEFVLADLADARAAFEEVTGRRTTEDLLAAIFGRFCIGK
jgi:tRNA modification GTPase